MQTAEETIQRLTVSLAKLEQLNETIVAGQERFGALSQRYLQIILETLQITRGAILRFVPMESELVIESAINMGQDLPGILVNSDEVTLMLDTPLIDLTRPPPALTPFLDRTQPELQALGASLWVPLKNRREFLGIVSLDLLSHRVEPGKWNRELLNVLANQTSIAMAHSHLLEQTRAAKFRLFLLSDITAQICRLLDTERLEEEVVNHAVSLLDANSGYLMIIDSFTQRLDMKTYFALNPRVHPQLKTLSITLTTEGEIPPALAMLREVATQGRTQICNDAETAAVFGAKNFITAPIFGREVLGVMVVCDKEGRGNIILDFTTEDSILLEAFANQVGVAIENARLYQEALEKRRLQAEMEEAARIQRNLLPHAPPEISGYQVAGLSIPCRDGIGGDYYDYIQNPDGSWGFAISDVSGKGMQAALLMAILRTGLRSEVARRKDLLTMVMTLNSLLHEGSTIDKYATLVYAQLHPETGVLISTNAGHNFPLVIRRDGSLKRLKKGGLVLGMYPDSMLRQIMEYEQETTQLCSGDTILFYTDGVTETLNCNDEAYGEERLEALIKQMRHADASEICTAIYDAAVAFQGGVGQFDDLTVMVLKKK